MFQNLLLGNPFERFEYFKNPRKVLEERTKTEREFGGCNELNGISLAVGNRGYNFKQRTTVKN